jgi:hypothetical protein
MENEDGNDEDDDERGGEKKDDRQKARLVWGELFQLNVLEILLQAVGEPLRTVIWGVHAGLDAGFCEWARMSWKPKLLSRMMEVDVKGV